MWLPCSHGPFGAALRLRVEGTPGERMQKMKRLIVNADDLGISERRNAGILEAHRRGIVTSASLMANGPAFADAVTMLRTAPELDVGLHLNLSEGTPIAEGHSTLVGADGRLLGKSGARSSAGRFDSAEVEREISEQLAVLASAGIKVTHLDGHHHLHLYGDVARAVSRAKVRWVRMPIDTLIPPGFSDADRLRVVEEYRTLGLAARPRFQDAGLRMTDHFGGAALSGHLTAETLLQALGALKDGLTELMVHPGRAEASDPARQRELEALTDPRVAAWLEDHSVQLTQFRDA